MNPVVLALTTFLITLPSVSAVTFRIEWGAFRGLNTNNGALVQLGFFTDQEDNVANLFNGDFIVLASTNIGVSGAFSESSIIDVIEGDANSPDVGSNLAIRFFDGSSVSSSSFFNVVSDPTSSWEVNLDLGNDSKTQLIIGSGLTQEIQAGSLLAPTPLIPIPEPSSALLSLISLPVIMRRKRN